MRQQLWDCGVRACHEMQDQQALYRAWTWAEARSAGWVLSSPSSYISMLLAVTALHAQPAEGSTFYGHAELPNVLLHVNMPTKLLRRML